MCRVIIVFFKYKIFYNACCKVVVRSTECGIQLLTVKTKRENKAAKKK